MSLHQGHCNKVRLYLLLGWAWAMRLIKPLAAACPVGLRSASAFCNMYRMASRVAPSMSLRSTCIITCRAVRMVIGEFREVSAVTTPVDLHVVPFTSGDPDVMCLSHPLTLPAPYSQSIACTLIISKAADIDWPCPILLCMQERHGFLPDDDCRQSPPSIRLCNRTMQQHVLGVAPCMSLKSTCAIAWNVSGVVVTFGTCALISMIYRLSYGLY